MKKLLFMSVLMLCIGAGCIAQSAEKKAITATIIAFAQAGDESDADKLATYLDDSYRIVMNRLFGSAEVAVMLKEEYLEKIRTKVFGGDQRKVQIESITLNGTTASAKVAFVGGKMTFVSILSLIKNANGAWKLISDVPVVK